MSDELVIDGDAVEIVPAGMDPITKAEIDVAISTAHRYPRSLRRFKDEVETLATLDEETAQECFYSLNRGGKNIQGPSVRLAEIAASAYGNLRVGARILPDSEDGRFVRALGVCHDLEKNTMVAIEATRRVTDKYGKRYNDDMIAVTSNAAASIALRNAIFRVIPKAFIKPAYLKAKDTALGKATSFNDRRNKVIDRLKGIHPSITVEKIAAACGKPSTDDLTRDDLVHLIGLGTAIKEGAVEVEEAFPQMSDTTVADVIGPTEKPEPGKERKTKIEGPSETKEPKKLSPAKVKSIQSTAEKLGLSPDDVYTILDQWGVKELADLPADREQDLLKAMADAVEK